MADQSRKLEVRVGIVTVIALAALVGGILWGKGIGIDRQRFVIAVASASGVSTGTPVNVRGVPKGGVAAIKITDEGAQITILVDRDIKLRRDASAVIQVLEITGGKKIELDPGHASEPFPDNATIPALNQGDVGAMLAFVGNLAHQIAPMLQRLDSTLASVNQVVGDPEFRANITSTLENLAGVSADLRGLLRENRGRINRTLDNVDALAANLRVFVDKHAPTVDHILTSVESLAADARTTLNRADVTIENVNRLALRVDSITVDVRTGKGMISRLLYDEKLGNELEKTLMELRKTLRDLNVNGVNVNMEVGHKH